MRMSKMKKFVLSSCCLTLMAGSAAIAQTGSMAGSMTGGMDASPADKHFVKTALMGGMAEVQLGQLAAQKGMSDDVKQFGQKMVDDHTKMGDDLKQVATQIGVTPPMMVSPADKALMTKLQAMSGDDFDKAYIRAMVKDHETDAREFKKEADSGSNAAVKDAASKGSEVIAMHLDMIKKIAMTHNVGTMASTK